MAQSGNSISKQNETITKVNYVAAVKYERYGRSLNYVLMRSGLWLTSLLLIIFLCLLVNVGLTALWTH